MDGKKKAGKTPRTIGWREWVALPALRIAKIKAKIDSGARTSALHAYYMEETTENGRRCVRFGIHPNQRDSRTRIHCRAEVLDERDVTDSGGHQERRLVILTPVVLGDRCWPIEITLTNRDTMRFRMLLGRAAIRRRYLIDPSASYRAGKPLPPTCG